MKMLSKFSHKQRHNKRYNSECSIHIILQCIQDLKTIISLIWHLLIKVQKCCSACSAIIADLTLHSFVSVHLCTCLVLHGYLSLTKTSGPTTKAAGSEVLL